MPGSALKSCISSKKAKLVVTNLHWKAKEQIKKGSGWPAGEGSGGCSGCAGMPDRRPMSRSVHRVCYRCLWTRGRLCARAMQGDTPRKNVLFGAPKAAEFRSTDPASALTPMHHSRARACFPMHEESDDSMQAESVTKQNSRTLAQWEAADPLAAPKSRSPRRSSGKFRTLREQAQAEGEEVDEDEREANGPAPSPMSVDTAGMDADLALDDSRESCLQSALEGEADDPFVEEAVAEAEEEDEFTVNAACSRLPRAGVFFTGDSYRLLAVWISLPAQAAACDQDASGFTEEASSFLPGAGAGEERTQELEADLGSMMARFNSEVASASRVTGVAPADKLRPGLQASEDDRTVELEGGLTDLMAKVGKTPEDRQAPGKEGPGAALADDDRTQELEANLSVLLRGASTSNGFGGQSPVEDSLVEDRTVELEAALSDLVAGTAGSPSGTNTRHCAVPWKPYAFTPCPSLPLASTSDPARLPLSLVFLFLSRPPAGSTTLGHHGGVPRAAAEPATPADSHAAICAHERPGHVRGVGSELDALSSERGRAGPHGKLCSELFSGRGGARHPVGSDALHPSRRGLPARCPRASPPGVRVWASVASWSRREGFEGVTVTLVHRDALQSHTAFFKFIVACPR